VNASLNILDQGEALERMRSQAKTQEKSLILNFSPETLWPLVSNTDLLNQKIGLQATQNSFAPLEQGGSLMAVETKAAGLKQIYQELPFEWLEPHFLTVERVYQQGLFKYLRFTILLEAQAEATRLTCRIDYLPAAPDLLLAPAVKENLSKMVHFWEQIGSALENGARGVEVFFDSQQPKQKEYQTLVSRWQKLAPESPVPEPLARFLLFAPERYAGRIRPFELAQFYCLDSLETLRFCLKATWAGDLHLRWDLRCPGCKGPKENSLHLENVVHQAYCPSCAAGYQIGFDQNLELSFFPDSRLRQLEEEHFCAGSPANTQHLAGQLNLWPLQEREVKLDLMPGEYLVNSLSARGELILRVSEQGLSSSVLNLDEEWSEALIELSPRASLRLKNGKPYFRNLQIEKTDWDAQVCSAALVSSLQDFRDLFALEAPVASLPLSRLTVLECEWLSPDLTLAPEELQEILGLVIQERDGALVNTCELKARAVFQDPLDAIRAIWSLQQRLQTLNHGLQDSEALGFKAGIAEGVCETWTHEGHLDYQGEAVEWAGFQRDLAQSGEVVIDAALFNDADLQWFLYRVRAQVKACLLPLENQESLTVFTIRFQGGQA